VLRYNGVSPYWRVPSKVPGNKALGKIRVLGATKWILTVAFGSGKVVKMKRGMVLEKWRMKMKNVNDVIAGVNGLVSLKEIEAVVKASKERVLALSNLARDKFIVGDTVSWQGQLGTAMRGEIKAVLKRNIKVATGKGQEWNIDPLRLTLVDRKVIATPAPVVEVEAEADESAPVEMTETAENEAVAL